MKNYSIVRQSFISGRVDVINSYNDFNDVYRAFIYLLNNQYTMLSDVCISGIDSSYRYYIGGELFAKIYIRRNNN